MTNWFRGLEGNIRFDEPLSKHTTFKIGGRAQFFIEPLDVDDLKLLLKIAKRYKIPFRIIGSGSNLLVSDKNIGGIVIRLAAHYFRKIRFASGLIRAGAGVSVSTLIKRALSLNLSGLEFLAGLPGTVGGALMMNAGTKDKVVGEIVEDVTVMDYAAKIKILNKKMLSFTYRDSNLSKYIILEARLRLVKGTKEEIRKKIKKYLDYRRLTQELSLPSAGCVFKNPSGLSAGKLIDACGLKGTHFGDARVSYKHANYIINKDKACATDVLRLMNFIKKRVKYKFDVDLKPEIKIWQK